MRMARFVRECHCLDRHHILVMHRWPTRIRSFIARLSFNFASSYIDELGAEAFEDA